MKTRVLQTDLNGLPRRVALRSEQSRSEIVVLWDGTDWQPTGGLRYSKVEGVPTVDTLTLPPCFRLTEECLRTLDALR